MSGVARLKRALIGCAMVLAVTAGAAVAADPTDTTFGTNGIAEIEARVVPPEYLDQVGGIADLEPTRGRKMLAAVYPIARDGHYFAAARINPDGTPDRSFGRNGITPYLNVSHRKGEERGVLQAEAVAGLRGGKVLLAGYYESFGELAPALARFTSTGRLDPGFGHGGKVVHIPPTTGGRLGRKEGAKSSTRWRSSRTGRSSGRGTSSPPARSLLRRRRRLAYRPARFPKPRPRRPHPAGRQGRRWRLVQIERFGGNGPGNTAMMLTRYR
jgi:uncharacterized delta-60 repeat protein